jgi:hypothetical protein
MNGQDIVPDTSNREQSDAQALSRGRATRVGRMAQP